MNNKRIAQWIGLALLVVGSLPLTVAAEEVTVPLEVPIAGVKTFSADKGSTDLLKGYVVEVYEFIVSGVALFAAIAIMYWGFRWVTAAGNQTIIGNAKEGITSALIGLVIALTSYTILALINPALVALPAAEVTRIQFAAEETENTSIAGFVSESMQACMADQGLTDAGDPTCTGLGQIDPAYTEAAGSTASLTLLPAAAAQWNAMAQEYHSIFGKKLRITHAFRSPAYQGCLVATGTGQSPAQPCDSNHNGGTAVDVNQASMTQAEYNWLVCGQEETCSFTNTTTKSGRPLQTPTSTHYGFRVLNYNDNKVSKDVWEQHHFDFETSATAETNVCIACPGLALCGCE